jgi:hypothetical protein
VKIKNVICVVDRSGFFNRDLAAIKAGAPLRSSLDGLSPQAHHLDRNGRNAHLNFPSFYPSIDEEISDDYARIYRGSISIQNQRLLQN